MNKFAWPPAREFMQEVFEASPAHLRQVLPADYFALSDLDAALTLSMTSELPFTIGIRGKIPPAHEYCSEVHNPMKRTSKLEIDPHKVQALLRQGANLKIQRFAAVSPKAQAIVSDVQDWLGFSTSANGYFSYGLQRGLPVHWDSHDILAVQLLGRKHWKIFRPTVELPVRLHREDAFAPPPPAAVCMEITLEAGDALYLPRGWWHDVTPVRGHKTLHLAVGLHPPTRADFLQWALNREILENVELRCALATGGADFTPVLARLGAALGRADLLAHYWREYAASVRPRGTFDLAETASGQEDRGTS